MPLTKNIDLVFLSEGNINISQQYIICFITWVRSSSSILTYSLASFQKVSWVTLTFQNDLHLFYIFANRGDK